MKVLTAYHTDVGIKRTVNEDSLCIQVAETDLGKIVMAIVCDGMGGQSKGELASAAVVRAFANWFNNELPKLHLTVESVCDSWTNIIQEQHRLIQNYASREGISKTSTPGTTLSVLLIVENTFMVIAHIGDTRIYRVTDNIEQLTEDQTWLQREVSSGRISLAEAKKDSRRNKLLQCIGASAEVTPTFLKGDAKPGEVYMLCSDGFRDKITTEEMFLAFNPKKLTKEKIMYQEAEKLTELNKQRKELDNITVLLVSLRGE